MERRISARRAARNFSSILDRVRDRADAFIVKQDGEPVCRIVPALRVKRTLGDLVRILDSAPKPDPEYWNIVEEITRNQPKLSSSSRVH